MQEIYDKINLFRANTSAFASSCGRHYVGVLPPLDINASLEEAAHWQATHQCGTPSHKTCDEWCFMFDGDCRHAARMKFFIFPLSSENENELLVYGPKHPFKHLLNSTGHCEMLLRNDINSMGGSIVGNLFILCIALLTW